MIGPIDYESRFRVGSQEPGSSDNLRETFRLVAEREAAGRVPTYRIAASIPSTVLSSGGPSRSSPRSVTR